MKKRTVSTSDFFIIITIIVVGITREYINIPTYCRTYRHINILNSSRNPAPE